MVLRPRFPEPEQRRHIHIQSPHGKLFTHGRLREEVLPHTSAGRVSLPTIPISKFRRKMAISPSPTMQQSKMCRVNQQVQNWLLIIYSLILQTNSSESLEFFTVLFLRCIAMSCAFVQIYFPDGVLLFFSSRLIVASLVPTMRAISFLAVFFWSKAKICDLCSEVN